MTDALSGCPFAVPALLGVERQLSPITQLNYQRQLDAIIAFSRRNRLKSWQQCDAAIVRSLRCAVGAKGWPCQSGATFSALRSFFDWLVSQGELKANLAKGVSATKAPRHLPKILMSTTLTAC